MPVYAVIDTLGVEVVEVTEEKSEAKLAIDSLSDKKYEYQDRYEIDKKSDKWAARKINEFINRTPNRAITPQIL